MAPNFPRPYGAPPPRNSAVPTPRMVSQEQPRPTVPARRFDILYLDSLGNIEDVVCAAPALPAIEASCSAFTHGTLIQTDMGDVPIEDLLPGQTVLTRDHGSQVLRWIGSMTLIPQSGDPRLSAAHLTRITESSIGIGKPNRDLILGPGARILRRNSACMSLFGTEAAFAPASAFADGVSIIDIMPVSPIRVFHLLLDGQHVITAGGVEVESYHPGRRDSIDIPGNLMGAFLDMFPMISDLSDFGQMRVPRLSEEDIRALETR